MHYSKFFEVAMNSVDKLDASHKVKAREIADLIKEMCVELNVKIPSTKTRIRMAQIIEKIVLRAR